MDPAFWDLAETGEDVQFAITMTTTTQCPNTTTPTKTAEIVLETLIQASYSQQAPQQVVRAKKEFSYSMNAVANFPFKMVQLLYSGAKLLSASLYYVLRMKVCFTDYGFSRVKGQMSQYTYKAVEKQLGIHDSVQLVVGKNDFVTIQKLKNLKAGKGSLHSLLMSNHQFYWDWVVVMRFLDEVGAMERSTFALASFLKRVPLFGWAMKMSRYIYLDRRWDLDKDVLRQGAAAFKHGPPGILILFPEGTFIESRTANESRKFAENNGIEEMVNATRVLVPRTKGTYELLRELNFTLDGFLDLTIAVSGIESTEEPYKQYDVAKLFTGLQQPPKNIKVLVEFIKIKEIQDCLDDYEKFKKWMFARFAMKEQRLQNYYKGVKYDYIELNEIF